METSAHAKLAALVAAWHNRHPLARRITPAQVRGEGVVALPFLTRQATRDEPTLAEAPSTSASTEATAPSSPTGTPEAVADAETAAATTPAADDAPAIDSPALDSPASAVPPAAAPSAAHRLQGTLAAWWTSVRDRLPSQARPARPTLDRAFDEDFIAPLRPVRIARFAQRQGTARRPGPDSWPQRVVQAKAGTDAGRTELLYLRTAAIEVGKQRRRVLIGAGMKGRVLGNRIWSRPRIAVVAVLCVIGLASPFAWQFSDRQGGQEALLAAAQRSAPEAAAVRSAASGVLAEASHASSAMASAAAASAGSEAAVQAASSPSAQAVVAQGPSSDSHPATAGAAAAAPVSATALVAAPSASVPPPGHSTSADPHSATRPAAASAPATGATTVAQADSAASANAKDTSQGIRPSLSPEAREAAKRESQALRAAKAASAAGPGSSASDAVAGDGKVYAVATPATRTRAGAQLRIVLMNAPTDAEAGQPRAEVMQVGDGWRAVIWPYSDRASAERTREQLASRGIPAEVIGF